MLVLSRKKNESIVINNDITIVVVEIRGDKVRLGVEAPREVPVHRREVYEAIKDNHGEVLPLKNQKPDRQKHLEKVIAIGKKLSIELSNFTGIEDFIKYLLNQTVLIGVDRKTVTDYKSSYGTH